MWKQLVGMRDFISPASGVLSEALYLEWREDVGQFGLWCEQQQKILSDESRVENIFPRN